VREPPLTAAEPRSGEGTSGNCGRAAARYERTDFQGKLQAELLVRPPNIRISWDLRRGRCSVGLTAASSSPITTTDARHDSLADRSGRVAARTVKKVLPTGDETVVEGPQRRVRRSFLGASSPAIVGRIYGADMQRTALASGLRERGWESRVAAGARASWTSGSRRRRRGGRAAASGARRAAMDYRTDWRGWARTGRAERAGWPTWRGMRRLVHRTRRSCSAAAARPRPPPSRSGHVRGDLRGCVCRDRLGAAAWP